MKTIEFLQASMGMGMGMGGPPCGFGPFPPCPIPLDSGVIGLLLLAMVYGAFSIIKKRKPTI